jgi:hypothetical protein
LPDTPAEDLHEPTFADTEGVSMRRTGVLVLGIVVALAGLLFTLQGVGVITGSAMSNTTFWSVAGPVIVVVGLVLAGVGLRGRTR